jgi:DNA-binding transcriptional ArsR family regulator
MKNGVASLYNILKDETRRKMIHLLNEKGHLSYTDFMRELEISNTGRLNYHLKVLNDLILKREDGQYALSEKGKVAWCLLLEFPEKNTQPSQIKLRWRRIFWTATGTLTALIALVNLILYGIGIVGLKRLFQSFLDTSAVIFVLYMIHRVIMDILSEKNAYNMLKTNTSIKTMKGS